MSRIKGNNVKFGGDFIVPLEEKNRNVSISHVYSKEKEMILNAENEAKQIVEKAQAEAAQIIENSKTEAQEEIAQMAEQARKDGFEVGKNQGKEAITKALSSKIIAVNDFAKGCFELKDVIIKSAHLDMVELITQIAHKVCTKSLELDDKILEEITLKAIHALKDKESINIIINPDMAEKIYAVSDELKEKIPQLESIKIIEDNSVSPDGAIVESPLSRVDSRISSQIAAIVGSLMLGLHSADTSELMPQLDESEKAEIETQDLNKDFVEENVTISEAPQAPETLEEEPIDSESIEPEIINADAVEEISSPEMQEPGSVETLDTNVEPDDGFKELEIPRIEENPNSESN